MFQSFVFRNMHSHKPKHTNMKKLLHTAAFSLLATCLMAQSGQITSMEQVTLPAGGSKGPQQILAADTITAYFDRATNFYTLKAGPAGYILGTGTTTTETACHYDAVGNVSVTDVIVYLAVRKPVGTADDVTFKVYTAGPDSMPQSLVASGTRNCATIPINAPAFIPMTTQISGVSGDFLVSIEYGNIDDTIAVISTNPTTTAGGPDGMYEKRTRQYTTLGWKRAWEIWSGSGGNYNADALVMPIVSFATGTQSLSTADFDLYKPFPCPATNNITLSCQLKQNTPATIVVYDEAGRTLGEYTPERSRSGKEELILDLTNYAAGNYFYSVQAGKSRLMSKFSVVK